MHLMTRRALDGILVLDGQALERLRIHRKARVNQLPCLGTLDHYAVHSDLINVQTDESVQIRVRSPGGFPPDLSGALDLRFDLNRFARRRHLVGDDEVICSRAGKIVRQSNL